MSSQTSTVDSGQPNPDAGRMAHQHASQMAAPGAALTQDLAGVIGREIIPRLMLLHGVRAAGDAPGTGRTAPDGPASEDDGAKARKALLECVLADDDAGARAVIDAQLRLGHDLEAVILQTIAPTARFLGRLWEHDAVSFVDVTIATSRLQQLIHSLRPAQPLSQDDQGRHILLLPAPGEQHTFGLLVLGEFFRNRGWSVTGGYQIAAAEAEQIIARSHQDVVGISLSNARLTEPLTKFISALRSRSRNRGLHVLVGGSVFEKEPALVERVGADACQSDPLDAVSHCETLLPPRQSGS